MTDIVQPALPTTPPQPTPEVEAFIDRWRASGAAERANYQLFLSELCDLLGVERPHPAVPEQAANAYVFEKPVPLAHGTTGFIDLYRRGAFVLEAKQGSEQPGATAALSAAAQAERQNRRRGTAVRGTAAWDTAMERARQQAQTYARGLPESELQDGRPPFLMVVDVGQTIALYSEFTRSGGHYHPFPDPHSYRLTLDDLRDAETRAMLRQVWDDPMALDPARRSARVTRDIAQRLGALAKSLEGGHDPGQVAQFLMRCLFTMFAEDVGLLPQRAFTHLLADLHQDPPSFKPMVEHLWATMNTGGFSVILRRPIPRFNGGLFVESDALPLDADQIQLLIEAARADWRDVEPAIFGTLLERALDPVERHKLGAHYTPRAYVERLVRPTIIDPLRAEWESVQVAAAQLADSGDGAAAVAEVEAFLRRLVEVRVLDPACGSGNFLYVTLELLKRLEGEVRNTLRDLGQGQQSLELEGFTVTPRQFFGLEINPRAAAIAELVLWIGYLQWHLRTRGDVRPPEPILSDLHNIECRDAVLAWDAVEPLRDAAGQPVTRWDGHTKKIHPVTGEKVPDETAQVPVYRYLNPRPAEWPAADYVVGNPPFIGTARMREALGDGYAEAIRATYPNVPASADYVMHWWDKAAELTRAGAVRRFGLITTNSLRQTFNRRVVQHHQAATPPLSLAFAIPDHPWVDSTEGAAVRIAMTVGVPGQADGRLQTVISETRAETDEAEVVLVERVGRIQADLTVGADVAGAQALLSNSELSCPGVKLHGAGFIITPEQASQLGLGRIAGIEQHIRSYRNGRDLTAVPRGVMVIDLYGLDVDEVRLQFPELYQWVYERVKPERDQNRDRQIRENWWLHGRPRPELRDMLAGLPRYIATVETSKHRFFVFLDADILPDNRLVNFAFDDAFSLGVLSSIVHITWTLAAGGTLEDRPVYTKTRCFETFPFPDATADHMARIRALGEQLDAHRKRQQAQYPGLTLTDMYNVLEKLRAGEALTAKDRQVHEHGLISVLKQLHDDLDAAVLAAYGWDDLRALPGDAREAQLLERLVALNAERAAEEAQGLVRWLRPEYQAPDSAAAEPGRVGQQAALLPSEEAAPATVERQAWPDTLPARAQAVRAALAAVAGPADVATVAAAFQGRTTGKRKDDIQAILQTLAALGQARETDNGRYVAA
jgi:hypothetical protein